MKINESLRKCQELQYHPTTVTESWESIFFRIGERLRRNRARCLFHDGDSPYSLSVSEAKGLFYCHVCHAGGDKITFIRELYKCSYPAALRWFGIEPGRPPAPDPKVIRIRKAKDGFRAWVKKAGRAMREQFYQEEMVAHAMRKRLQQNPEDAEAWDILATAMHGHAALEHKLDCINGSLEEQAELYKFMRGR